MPARCGSKSFRQIRKGGPRGQVKKTEHPHPLGRRYRLVEHQLQQPRADGLSHSQHRPRRQRRRRLHRLLRPAELHRGPRRLHHRAEPDPHRAHQGRHAGRRRRPQRGRSDHRRTPEAARLQDRPVRQEPSRRQGSVPADAARLRRILRQSLSPQRRRGARGPGLSEGPGVQEAFRPARRAALQGRRQGRPDNRGHRPADEEADGDHRRRGDGARAQVHRRGAQGREALLPLVQHDRHAFPDPSGREAQGQEQRPGRLQRRDGRA